MDEHSPNHRPKTNGGVCDPSTTNDLSPWLAQPNTRCP